MKIRLAVALIGLALSFAVPAFAQDKDTGDPKIAEQIRALAAKYEEAFNKHDPAAVAALYTEDGVWRTAHYGAFYGRKSIEKCLTQHRFQTSRHGTIEDTVDRVNAGGNEVRAHGTWSLNYLASNGSPGNVDGTFSWVIVREGDTWKIRRDNQIAAIEHGFGGVEDVEW